MKILIVDDNSDDREILRIIIERHGHEVIAAADGLEGLHKAKTKAPDLIISDALMPVMDGFQFLRNIQHDNMLRRIPFIFYSATYKGYQDVQLAISLGAAAYIIKPKDPAEMWQEIEQVIKEGKKEPATAAMPLIEEDEEYLKRYSHIVALKLEEKIKELEAEISARRKAEEELKIASGFIISNVTERKKLEAQLLQAQKMEAIGQLAGGIAHDFNNILCAIIGYANILEMKMPADDPLRMDVEHILESSERAANLTQGLLAFGKKQLIALKPININNLIRRVGKFLTRIIGEDIELSMNLWTTDIMVMADSGQLEQVLMNIAANARDAMPRGGQLLIETALVEVDEEFIRAHGYGEQGQYAFIALSDTGIGMEKAILERVFEPFFTTKDAGKGSGLGLSIVYGIIKQHNGYINAYSEPGHGTTFKIHLPVLAADTREAKPSVAAPASIPTGTETILVAEDDAPLRNLIITALESFGYQAIVAADGEAATREFMKNKNRIALVILDLIMPKKSGMEVYETIKGAAPEVKAIFMSGYPADKIFREGYLKEGLDFIMKPISPGDLLRKVREVLEKR